MAVWMWVLRNVRGAVTDDDRCEHKDPDWWKRRSRDWLDDTPSRKPSVCGEPAGVIITGGCVHEHVGTAVICESHWLEREADLEAGRVVCWDCRVAGDNRHSCTARLISVKKV